ncbi:MAG: hypothetical protein I8H77_17015 [Comamonadaceae bacterium]|nr:hypothetical protein [Comamonadaceae bacterium]
MKHDPRYAWWAEIVGALAALHEVAYGEKGYLAEIKHGPYRWSGLEAAQWIRNKCALGRWYWWGETTLAGKAQEPLRSFNRVIEDSGGMYEENEPGRELIARIDHLQQRIAAISRM